MPNCYIIIHNFIQYCHIGMFVTMFGQNVIPFFVVRSEITLQQCCPLSISYKFLNCTSINFHLLIVIDILLTAIKQRRFRTVIHLHHHLHFSHLNVSLNHFDVPTIFFKHNIFTFIIFLFPNTSTYMLHTFAISKKQAFDSFCIEFAHFLLQNNCMHNFFNHMHLCNAKLPLLHFSVGITECELTFLL
jgi:hypothetical protein